MACAGLLENESTVAGGGKQYFSLVVPKLYGCPTRSQGPPCRMEACVALKVLKYSWTVLNHCFVVDGCIFCSAKVSCCPWTVGGIV
ncbi:hypothetical protein TNCT_403241 [Trichonephila clavata]|uniref:Uncharacterized protein n=1 Tax=Trichonephila clavata TaxID=2740835 RepID=A0A8X6JWJ0_TRICU|nr:hypothetical protein TNCT_403241 [Trichonephila clavata]